MRTLRWIRDALRHRRGQTNWPRYLTYIVTFTCNARCIMCDSWKKPSPGDLTLTEIETIFRQLGRLDAVRLTGGEPFVRGDLLEIARLAQACLQPLFLHITSNGFLTSRIVEFCEQRPKRIPLHLLISLDGLKDKHNTVRGRPTAWDTTLATLHALAPRQRELNLKLAVNQTIVDPEGVAHYRHLHQLLQPAGIRHHAVLAYEASATYNLQPQIELAPSDPGSFTPFGSFTPEQIEMLVHEAARDLHEAPFLERLAKRYYFRGILNRLNHHRGDPNPSCVALNSHLRLLPNGDVPVCQFNSRTVGNLRRQSFREVWYGQKITPERAWVRRCPGCWAECEVIPSAIYTGDLLRQALTRKLAQPVPRRPAEPEPEPELEPEPECSASGHRR